MSTTAHIWLKDLDLEELNDAFTEKEKRIPRFESIDGRRAIRVYSNIFDPTMKRLDVPEEIIDEITFREENIVRGLRTEGVYHHEGVDVLVVTRPTKVISDRSITLYEAQDVHMTAPTWEALREAYSLFRQGKLSPVQNWEQETASNEAAEDSTPREE